MTFNTFRTSNRQSVKFRTRMFFRRTRDRALSELIRVLNGNTSATA